MKRAEKSPLVLSGVRKLIFNAKTGTVVTSVIATSVFLLAKCCWNGDCGELDQVNGSIEHAAAQITDSFCLVSTQQTTITSVEEFIVNTITFPTK